MKISDILQKIGKFFGFIPKDKEVIRYCKLLTIKKVEKNNKIIDELFEIIKSDKISVVHKEDEDSFFQFIECDVTREFVFSKLTGYDDLYDYVLQYSYIFYLFSRKFHSLETNDYNVLIGVVDLLF